MSYGWEMMAVGTVMAAAGGYMIWRSAGTRSWPSVAGEVIDSHVEVSETEDLDDDNRSRTRTVYDPAVRYRYCVKGKEFVGERISIGIGGHSSEGAALRVVERYPAGARVRVFVSPADPSEAVLETGVKAGPILLLAIGIVGVVVGKFI